MKVDFIVERGGDRLLVGRTKGSDGFEYQFVGEAPVLFETAYELGEALRELATEPVDPMNHRAGCAKEAYPTVLVKWPVETDGLEPLPRSMFIEPVVEADEEAVWDTDSSDDE